MVINKTRSETVLISVTRALTRKQRVLGLMGKNSISHVLAIPNCQQVHTCFMRFPINVLFLDAEQTIVHVERDMKPWRISKKVEQSHIVLEFAVDVTSMNLWELGDQVSIQEEPS